MTKISQAKCMHLATYLWLIFSNALLIYSLAAPNSRHMYTRLALTALATIMLSLRLDTLSAMLSAFVSTSLGLLGLHFHPLLPHVSKKAFPTFQKAFSQYQTTLWHYGWLVIALTVLLAYMIARAVNKNTKAETTDTPLMKGQSKIKFSTFDLTSMAIFVAFGVVINTVRAGYFSFGGFPIILAGLSLGPIQGFFVGLLTDLVGFVVRPGGAFSPVYALTSALTGFIPIYILQLLKNARKSNSEIDFKTCKYWQLLLAVAIGQFLTSVLIVSLSRAFLYAQGSFSYFFITTLSRQVFNVPLYTYLSLGILQSVNLANLRWHKYSRSCKNNN